MSLKRLNIVKQLYFTIVTIVVLVMMLISGGYLISAGLYSGVFTGDEVPKGYPPAPYFMGLQSFDADYSCDTACDLSVQEQAEIDEWLISYDEWKNSQPERFDRDGLVTALSFFIIAVPLFIVHFRMLRKNHKEAQEQANETTIFYVYYYIVALGTLIAAVVYVALLINATLRTWVIITDVDNGKVPIVREIPIKDTTLATISDCSDACEFTEEQLVLVESYEEDVKNSDSYYSSGSSWQHRFSSSLAALLVTVPFFFYHWIIIKRKLKSKETN